MRYRLWSLVPETLKHPLARQGSWAMTSAAVQAGTAFIANLVLVRFLLPEDFGRFALVQANIGLVATILSLRLNVLLLRASDDELENGGRDLYLSALLVEILVVFIVSLVVLWIFDLWNILAILLLLSMLVSLWVGAQRTLYERQFRYKTLGLLEAGAHLASHVLAVVGVVIGLGVAVLFLRLWVQALGQLLSLYRLGGLQGFRIRLLSLNDWKQIIQQVRGYWADGLLEQSFERIVIILIGSLAGPRATGYFFQARRLAITPHQILQPIAFRVWFNYLSHRVSKEKRFSALKRLLALEILLLVFAGIAVILWSDEVIPYLFGAGWEPVVPMLKAMVGVILGLSLFNTLKAYFMALGRMRPFIVIGRGVQFGAIGVAALLALLGEVAPGLSLSFGLSAGYLTGAILLFLAVAFLQRNAAPLAEYESSANSLGNSSKL